MYCEQFFEFQIHFLLVGSELLLERRIYNHLKYEDRFMMILSGKFIREILDLPQTFNVLCKTRTSEEMGGALNEIAFEDIGHIIVSFKNCNFIKCSVHFFRSPCLKQHVKSLGQVKDFSDKFP